LSNQKNNHFYKWDKVTNDLNKLPMNDSFLKESISWYQTADFLFTHKKLEEK
jgi:hypothetical protein